MTDQGTITLPNGHTLGYSEYGVPGGRPVFFFHGMPGSRFFHPPDAVTRTLGVRLITVDRPGYGLSDFQPGRRILDWPDDITRLADMAGIGKFAIAGHSGGGPYVAACAYALPDRVTAAAIVSGAGPAGMPGVTEGMSTINKFGYTYGRHIPWPVWQGIFWLVNHRRREDPGAAMDKGSGHRPRADEEQINLPEVRQVCLDSEVEAFRNGLQGMAWDARLLTRPWGFPLNQIRIPVHIWQGSDDDLANMAMARGTANQIPGSRITIFRGEAHLILFPHWEEILSQLILE